MAFHTPGMVVAPMLAKSLQQIIKGFSGRKINKLKSMKTNSQHNHIYLEAHMHNITYFYQ